MDTQKILDRLAEAVTNVGLKLIFTALILVIGLKLSKWVIKWINRGHGYSKLDAGVRTFINSALKIVLNALVVLTAAYVLGIPMTSFMTVLASCGLAVGLALQGALSNLAGGLMILIFKPFRVGDYIETNGKTGTVHDITVFYTVLYTADNHVVTIPNGTVMAGDVVNYWQKEEVRLDIPCSTSYSDDIDKTRDVLLTLASETPEALDTPAPEVILTTMNSSSLDFVMRIWVKSGDYWKVKLSLPEQVKKAFDKNGISIPFPQLDVHTK